MFAYCAYGLVIHSSLPLPELRAVGPVRKPDVTIRLGPVSSPDGVPLVHGFRAVTTLRQTTLHWARVGAFLVRDGQDIIVSPEDEDPSLLRSFILGACMGVLLHQRRLLVLHASAVIMDGGAVAFIGHKGLGKSTTAAALHNKRYPLLTDDVLALDGSDTGLPVARTGFAQLKLWPEAVAASLGENPEALPRVHAEMEKRVKRLDDTSERQLIPLRQIYVLDAGPELSTEPLPASEALVELLRHSYAPRFVGSQGTPPWHFQQCAALATAIPIYRLKRRVDLDALPEIITLIESNTTHS